MYSSSVFNSSSDRGYASDRFISINSLSTTSSSSSTTSTTSSTITLPQGRLCQVQGINDKLCSNHYYFSFFHQMIYNDKAYLRPGIIPFIKTGIYFPLKDEKKPLMTLIKKKLENDFEDKELIKLIWSIFEDRIDYSIDDLSFFFNSIKNLEGDWKSEFAVCFDLAKNKLRSLEKIPLSELVQFKYDLLTDSEVQILNKLIPAPAQDNQEDCMMGLFDDGALDNIQKGGRVACCLYNESELSKIEARIKLKTSEIKEGYNPVMILELVRSKGQSSYSQIYHAYSLEEENIDVYFGIIVRLIREAQKNCMEPIAHFFDKHKELKKQEIERNYNLIKALLKEQKKHVFGRFQNMCDYYAAFVRRVKMIAAEADTLSPENGKKQVLGVVKQILIKSYKKYDKTKDKDKRPDEIVVEDDHHKPSIMGYESETIPDQDKVKCYKKTAFIFRLQQGKEKIAKGNTSEEIHQSLHYARSHTQPFPAMFNWKKESIQHFLKFENECAYPIVFSRSAFMEVKSRPKDGDKLFLKELKVIRIQKESETDSAKRIKLFTFEALYTLTQLSLRLHSETEHLPTFVNEKLDTLSEWNFGDDSNFKKSIANAVVNMLEQEDDDLDANTSWQHFREYRTQTLNKINKNVATWKRKDSTMNLILRVGAIQTKQAMIASSPVAESTEYAVPEESEGEAVPEESEE